MGDFQENRQLYMIQPDGFRYTHYGDRSSEHFYKIDLSKHALKRVRMVTKQFDGEAPRDYSIPLLASLLYYRNAQYQSQRVKRMAEVHLAEILCMKKGFCHKNSTFNKNIQYQIQDKADIGEKLLRLQRMCFLK